jgi:hypothetical protein
VEENKTSPPDSSPSIPSCSLCGPGFSAIALFYMPSGCIAYHRLIFQFLCLHHIRKAQPSNGMYLIEDYTEKKEFTSAWNKGII